MAMVLSSTSASYCFDFAECYFRQCNSQVSSCFLLNINLTWVNVIRLCVARFSHLSQICMNKRCVAVSSLQHPRCPADASGRECSGRGVSTTRVIFGRSVADAACSVFPFLLL